MEHPSRYGRRQQKTMRIRQERELNNGKASGVINMSRATLECSMCGGLHLSPLTSRAVGVFIPQGSSASVLGSPTQTYTHATIPNWRF